MPASSSAIVQPEPGWEERRVRGALGHHGNAVSPAKDSPGQEGGAASSQRATFSEISDQPVLTKHVTSRTKGIMA